MRLIILASSFAALSACQSCKNHPAPHPPLPSEVQDGGAQDSGTSDASSDASVPVEAGVLADASASDAGPVNPCWAGVIGPMHAFCEGDAPTMVSTEPASVDSKKKLYSALSAATTRTRLIVRHANSSHAARFKTVILFENMGTAQAKLVLLKKGVAGPTLDVPTGEELAAGRWSASKVSPPVMVNVGKAVRLDPSIEVGLAEKYATMGYYEYSFDQPHRVHVCFVGEREDASVCQGLTP